MSIGSQRLCGIAIAVAPRGPLDEGTPGSGQRGLDLDHGGQPGGVDHQHARAGFQPDGHAGGRLRGTGCVDIADEVAAAEAAQLRTFPLDRGTAIDDHETLPSGPFLVGEPAPGGQHCLIACQLKKAWQARVGWMLGQRTHSYVVPYARYKMVTR